MLQGRRLLDERGHGLVEDVRLLEVPEVGGAGDDPQLGGRYPRREFPGEGDIGAVVGPAENERRHRHPAQSRKQIEPAELAQPGQVGALAAAAEVLLGGLRMLSPPTRVGPPKRASEQRLGHDPCDSPLQFEPSRRASESA